MRLTISMDNQVHILNISLRLKPLFQGLPRRPFLTSYLLNPYSILLSPVLVCLRLLTFLLLEPSIHPRDGWPASGRSLPSSLHRAKGKHLLHRLLFCCLLSIVFSAVSLACPRNPLMISDDVYPCSFCCRYRCCAFYHWNFVVLFCFVLILIIGLEYLCAFQRVIICHMLSICFAFLFALLKCFLDRLCNF